MSSVGIPLSAAQFQTITREGGNLDAVGDGEVTNLKRREKGLLGKTSCVRIGFVLVRAIVKTC